MMELFSSCPGMLIVIADSSSAMDVYSQKFIDSMRTFMVVCGIFICLAGFATGVARYGKSGDANDIIITLLRLLVVVGIITLIGTYVPKLQTYIRNTADMNNKEIKKEMTKWQKNIGEALDKSTTTANDKISSKKGKGKDSGVEKTVLDTILLNCIAKLMLLGDLIRLFFRVLQSFILKMMIAIAPFTVSCLMLPAMHSMASKYFLTLFGVLCIPLSFAIADAALIEFWSILAGNALIAGTAAGVSAIGFFSNPAGWVAILIGGAATLGMMVTLTLSLYIAAPAILISLMRGENPASAMMNAFTAAAALQRAGGNVGKSAVEAGAAGAGTAAGLFKKGMGAVSGGDGGKSGEASGGTTLPDLAPISSPGVQAAFNSAGKTNVSGAPGMSETTNTMPVGSNNSGGKGISGALGSMTGHAASGMNQLGQTMMSSAGASLADGGGGSGAMPVTSQENIQNPYEFDQAHMEKSATSMAGKMEKASLELSELMNKKMPISEKILRGEK